MVRTGVQVSIYSHCYHQAAKTILSSPVFTDFTNEKAPETPSQGLVPHIVDKF